MKQKGASTAKAKANHAPEVTNREPFPDVDFVSQGEPEAVDGDPEMSAPAAAPPMGEPIPDEPPDPERHRHPESTRRSTR